MKKIIFLAIGILFSLSIQSQSNRYVLDFTKHLQNSIHVKANLDLTVSKNKIFMITHGSEKNPEGEAKFIQNLTAKNSKGQKQNIKYLGEGSWEIASANYGNMTIEYDILLNHDKENWDNSGGYDEVTYKTSEGLFFTGYSLFLVPDVESLGSIKDVKVDFILPPGWKASTPWNTASKANSFIVNDDIRFLLNNCIFVGNHYQKEIKLGNFELLLVLGNSVKNSESSFIELMEPIILSTTKVFDGSPKKKYLVVVNESQTITDGGAFRNSFSQIIKGEVNRNSRTVWGHIMAHEIIHLWNGHTLIPKEQEEWFKEGFTDYLTNILLTQNKLIDECTFYKRFENVVTKYNLARNLLNSKAGIREAGANKAENRYLIYGGGELVALALDIEIRKATHNSKSINTLFSNMYQHFGKINKPYELNDIITEVNSITGKNHQAFFDDYVIGNKTIPVEDYLAAMGLQLNGFLEEVYISSMDNLTPEQLQIKKGILGL